MYGDSKPVHPELEELGENPRLPNEDFRIVSGLLKPRASFVDMLEIEEAEQSKGWERD